MRRENETNREREREKVKEKERKGKKEKERERNRETHIENHTKQSINTISTRNWTSEKTQSIAKKHTNDSNDRYKSHTKKKREIERQLSWSCGAFCSLRSNFN